MVQLVIFINLFFIPLLPLYIIYRKRQKPLEPNLDLLFHYGILAVCNIPLTKIFVFLIKKIGGIFISIDSGYYTVAALLPTILTIMFSYKNLVQDMVLNWRKKREDHKKFESRKSNQDSEIIYNKISQILLALFAVVLFTRACLGPVWYGEIDSNALPVISIQYRGSIFMNESDLSLARQDFPNLYEGIYKYEDLRASKLRVNSENQWTSYYFPIYPAFCVPIKLLLSLFHADQERCFFITNALMVTFSLWFMQRKLKVTAKQRLLALILLIFSPIVFYVNHINYEAFLFSFLTLSLVQYHNKQYRSSAVLLSLAGMSNPTVMAVGIVMVVEYLYRMMRTCLHNPRNHKNLRKYVVDTVLYGMCYIPCLIPFAIDISLMMGRYITATTTGSSNLLPRFLTYLFDPTLGFFTFAPIALLAFLVLVIIALVQKRFQALVWAAFLFGTVFAFSLHPHINCGMLYCARYLAWTYPIIPLFLVTIGYETIRSHVGKCILFPVLIATTGMLLCVNMGNRESEITRYVFFNPVTRWILQEVPQVYNPYSATFYSRTLHKDGAYNINTPAYYEDTKSLEIRKLIFKADPESIEQVISDLAGDDASVGYLKAQLDRYGLDGKYHYVNFPRAGKYQVHLRTPEEKGEMRSVATLLEANNFSLDNAVGGYQLAGFPISIKKDTLYKVELTLADNVDFATAAELAVDFYGPEYDRPEQEAILFVEDGRYRYTFYFDSGEFDSGSDVLDCEARLFDGNLDTVIQVESFSVTEMERLLFED